MYGAGFFPFVLIAIAAYFIAAAILQWLWNITMPEALNLKKIRYWIAFRLLLIAGILTSAGSGFSHGPGS